MRVWAWVAAFCAAAFPAAAKDAARGAQLAAANCVACHGEAGVSRLAGVPSLAGQSAEFVTLQMILFREGLRQVPAMAGAAAGLQDNDIEDLAAFFAALPPGVPEDRGARNAALYAAGQAMSGPRNCGVCHMPDYRGQNQVPRLAGQREDYLVHALLEYRGGLRVGTDTSMSAVMHGVTDADIAALAHYLSQRD
jgi:cytochrome c553